MGTDQIKKKLLATGEAYYILPKYIISKKLTSSDVLVLTVLIDIAPTINIRYIADESYFRCSVKNFLDRKLQCMTGFMISKSLDNLEKLGLIECIMYKCENSVKTKRFIKLKEQKIESFIRNQENESIESFEGEIYKVS